jgi:hypothetical protein
LACSFLLIRHVEQQVEVAEIVTVEDICNLLLLLKEHDWMHGFAERLQQTTFLEAYENFRTR